MVWWDGYVPLDKIFLAPIILVLRTLIRNPFWGPIGDSHVSSV